MPKLLPVDWRILEAVFEADGFVFERQRGSHRVYVKFGLPRPVVIPVYDEVPIFVIQNNLRTAGMKRATYFRLLSKIVN
ncbi:MAG: type II toxin-antitoxin system HicA family toxin [Magnetococcus sp. YQC-5]